MGHGKHESQQAQGGQRKISRKRDWGLTWEKRVEMTVGVVAQATEKVLRGMLVVLLSAAAFGALRKTTGGLPLYKVYM